MTLPSLLLAAAVAHAAAAQPPADRDAEEYHAWVLATSEDLRLPPVTTRLLLSLKGPKSLQIFEVADLIFRDDRTLRRYLVRLERNLEKHKRLSSWDRKALEIMKNTLRSDKEEALQKLDGLAKTLGLAPKPEATQWADAISNASPRHGDERYNPESGLWERYDAAARSWAALPLKD